MGTDLKSISVQLDSLISKNGLKKTWLTILYTHLNTQNKFSYVTKDPAFLKIKPLKKDLISKLTIGEISVLYEYSVSLKDSKSRKSNGQFFTPDDVSEFMAKAAFNFSPGTWLDPCSGIGNLSWHLAKMQKDPEQFILESLVLSDKDPLALLIARVIFTVSFQKNYDDLFYRISDKFISLDFLSVAHKNEETLFCNDDNLGMIPDHDFVIVNPPYLATKIDQRFETAKAGDLYAYFLENIIKTSKGFVAITPQSFTNAGKFQSLRKLLIEHYQSLSIYNFDNVPANVFKGYKFGSSNSNKSNSIRAAIVVAKPGPGSHKITQLLRWRSDERKLLFKNLDKFLSEVNLTDNFFPKVGKPFGKLYADVSTLPTLKTILVSKKTKFSLHVPSAPRYFIPALMKPVKRTSQKTIYFATEEDRNLAYLLINSSFMYWWWRLRDGGMTLSLETLTSLPLLQRKVNDKLVKELKNSELNSKVYKKNAGSMQENVKHPIKLISKVNKWLLPDYFEDLTKLHGNSDIKLFLEKN
jgi:hypothetical protein